jgi:hypothetical protein
LSHDFPHHFPHHCPMICHQNSLSARTSSSPPHGLHHEPVGRLQTPESRAVAQAAHAEAHIGEDLAQWRGVWNPRKNPGKFVGFPWKFIENSWSSGCF